MPNDNQIMPRRLLAAFIIAIVFMFAMTSFSWASTMYWPQLPFMVNLVVQTLLIIVMSITIYKVLNRPK